MHTGTQVLTQSMHIPNNDQHKKKPSVPLMKMHTHKSLYSQKTRRPLFPLTTKSKSVLSVTVEAVVRDRMS